MNNDRETPDSDDQDLTRLFDAQQDTIPETLDRLIMAAAKDAVAEPAMTGNKRPGTAIKGWFAVAATLLLGMALAPLLMQAPESALDGAASTDSTLEAVEESLSMTAEPSMHEMRDSESGAGSSSARKETPGSVSNALMPAIQARNRTAKTESSTLTQVKRISGNEQYRRSPASWLEHIRKLVHDDHPDEARTEYDLFRKAFPEYAPDFRLDAPPE